MPDSCSGAMYAGVPRIVPGGVIRRLMVHPATNLELVMGKIYGLMLLGAVQILFFLAVGKFAMGVNLGANLPAQIGRVVHVFQHDPVDAGLAVNCRFADGARFDRAQRMAGGRRAGQRADVNHRDHGRAP